MLHGLLYVSGIKNAFIGLSNPYLSIILPCDLCVGLTVKRTLTEEGEVSDESAASFVNLQISYC